MESIINFCYDGRIYCSDHDHFDYSGKFTGRYDYRKLYDKYDCRKLHDKFSNPDCIGNSYHHTEPGYTSNNSGLSGSVAPSDGVTVGFNGRYIDSICGQKIYYIDSIPTIITSVKKNIAKGYILNNDLTLTPCFIAKNDSLFNRALFAHGDNLKSALSALQDGIIIRLNVDERVKAFVNAHPNGNTTYTVEHFSTWHFRLTGSYNLGCNYFADSNGLNTTDNMTVLEFIKLAKKDEYCSKIIKQLTQHYKKKKSTQTTKKGKEKQ